jgi:hypothetical protein
MFYTLFILILALFSLFVGYVLGKDKQKKEVDLYWKNLARYMTPETKTEMLHAMDLYTTDLKKMKELLNADN